MRRISTLLCPCVAAAFLFSAPALAQDAQIQTPSHSTQPRNAAKVQELQRIIAEQQRQLDAQQEQLEAQEKTLQELQQQVQGLAESAPPRQAPQATQQATEPSQTLETAKHTSTSAEKEELEREESVFQKLLRDPRTWPEGMKRPDGWIGVPGRKTDVRFGGFVQVNFIHDFQNGNGLRNLPDAVARIRWHQDWGHLTGAVLGRQL
jgi:hypothetical protein